MIRTFFERLFTAYHKFVHITSEMSRLVKKEKAFYIVPIFLALAVISLLVYHVGPTLVVSFIYAGL